mmetsp:Transcript_140081/g.247582  ORF Transcript_140081/g.247582 Transcript_140081/m.247582 type:complete len:99 (+) Transcript_140081:58-354(+)
MPSPERAVPPPSVPAEDNFLGLRELVPDWNRIGPDEQRDFHKRMREAVRKRLIPARRGPRWQWARDDPILPLVRRILADADFIGDACARISYGLPPCP